MADDVNTVEAILSLHLFSCWISSSKFWTRNAKSGMDLLQKNPELVLETAANLSSTAHQRPRLGSEGHNVEGSWFNDSLRMKEGVTVLQSLHAF